jgi:GTP cyclohydrolase I
MYVDLPHQYKGTHMSRFIEVLSQYRQEISPQNLSTILEAIKGRLDAESAHMELTFPYFIEKTAPVSGTPSLMEYTCTFVGSVNGQGNDIIVEVAVPITTLCPCSKEISEFGAHNSAVSSIWPPDAKNSSGSRIWSRWWSHRAPRKFFPC